MRTCWYRKWDWKYRKNTFSLVWKQLPRSYFWAISTSCLALKQEAVKIITVTMFKFSSFLKPCKQVSDSIGSGSFLLKSNKFYPPHFVLFWLRITVHSQVFLAEGLFRSPRLHFCQWQSFGCKEFLLVLYSCRIWLRSQCLTVMPTYNSMNHVVAIVLKQQITVEQINLLICKCLGF